MATNPKRIFSRAARNAFASSIRKKATGRIRLSVFRSGKHIYAQIIDDAAGRTLAAASTLDKDLKGKVKSTSTVEAAKAVGALIAKKAARQPKSRKSYSIAAATFITGA